MPETSRTGRAMEARLRVSGWLRTQTPLHVGGAGHEPRGALAIAVDGLGRVYVPGTSLAGALRAWSEGASRDGSELRDLWGYAEHRGPEGKASRVVVRDALVTADTSLGRNGIPAAPLDSRRLETRTGVGIDRVTGTAAPGILHDRTVVPAGVFLRLGLDVETTGQELDRDRARLGELLASLATGQVRLGAATTRGLGRIVLSDDLLRIEEDRLDSKAGLLALLAGDSGRRRTIAELRAAGSAGLPPRREQVTAEISWRPLAAVMVKSAADGFAVSTVPLTTSVAAGQLALALPGSSIKGALRSRAEWIERTVCGIDPARPDDDSITAAAAAFRAQLDELPAVRALFGAAPRGPQSGNAGSPDDDGRGRGAVAVDDCVSVTTVPEQLWQQVYGVPEPGQDGAGERAELPAGLREQLAAAGLHQADHVAIDRWTGGAAEGRLYSVLEPDGISWEPIRITIDLTRLGEAGDLIADAALALLLLVLRDLAEGWIPLGHGSNRGMGDMEVTRLRLTGPAWPEGTELTSPLASDEAERLTKQWQSYADGRSR